MRDFRGGEFYDGAKSSFCPDCGAHFPFGFRVCTKCGYRRSLIRRWLGKLLKYTPLVGLVALAVGAYLSYQGVLTQIGNVQRSAREFYITNRPFVGVSNVDFRPDGSRVGLGATIYNCGKLVARRIQARVSVTRGPNLIISEKATISYLEPEGNASFIFGNINIAGDSVVEMRLVVTWQSHDLEETDSSTVYYWAEGLHMGAPRLYKMDVTAGEEIFDRR